MTQLFFDFENNYITTADTLAILGMDNVGTLKIKIHDAIDDRTEVLEIDLRDESKVTDWFWYFYSPITKKKEIVISFSPISNRRTLTRTSNIEFLFLPESGKNSSNYLQTKPAVSEIVVGTKYTLGKTMYGMNLSIQDFSRVERDDFGNAFVNKRSFAKRMSVPVRIDTATTDSVFFTMSDVRATPVVWVADMGFRASIIFGFYTEFSIALQDFNDTLVNLEVLGLPE